MLEANKYASMKTLNPEPDKTPQGFAHGPDVQHRDQVEVFRQSYLDDLVDFDFYSCSESEYKKLEAKFILHMERIRSIVEQTEAHESDCESELEKHEDAELPNQIEVRESELEKHEDAELPNQIEVRESELEKNEDAELPNQIEVRESELDKIEDAELRKQENSAKKSSSKIGGEKRAMQVTTDKIRGEKHAVQVTPDRESKRSKTTEVNLTETRKAEATMMRRCSAILDKLMKHKHGWVFNKPVDAVALKLPDYHQIVKRPMDLGTVKLKLGKGGYGTPLDFAKDVRLTFDNAMLYNLKGDVVHTMASILLDIFDKSFNPAYEKFEVERQCGIVEQRKIGKPLQGLTQDDRKEALCDEAPLVKALELDKRNSEETSTKYVSKKQRKVPEVKENRRMRGKMSDLERDQLGHVVQELAEEYLDEILQIVAKRNPKTTIPNGDGEVELDFVDLDDETMWDLHRFVRQLNSKAEENDRVI